MTNETSAKSDLHAELTLLPARLSKAGDTIRFEAGEADRQRIAAELDLAGLSKFAGTLLAAPWQKGGVRVTGRLVANATHESVVTLEPVERSYRFDVAMTFVPDTSRLLRITSPGEQELFVDPEGEDPPEPFSGDTIDLAPYIQELLALELDPYPREEGEAFEPVDTDPAPDVGKVSPFADLAALKKQQGEDK
ncbi:DUF177 domain-containing protein [Fulvimarina sp. 2208YS6-2-32]|uniref:DUF177 domain-containing protein n=1 Tax=Fulvimarina uroteuthidis TaxID=3098149 RepID=A0ABU5I2P6_9HYPH|nr:DUF177 domain-containing protein [Fulvimarina sp. 2208YS6-2-32]MDY8109610.1 DUF177 domain-containing protein [Fulvimarina sp. 2208YS6-2-32]